MDPISSSINTGGTYGHPDTDGHRCQNDPKDPPPVTRTCFFTLLPQISPPSELVIHAIATIDSVSQCSRSNTATGVCSPSSAYASEAH